MSTPSINPTLAGVPAAWSAANPSERIAQALDALWSALEAGDPSGAAKAFLTLQSQMKVPAQVAVLLTKNPEVQQELGALRQAVESGDTEAAKGAVTGLQRQLATAQTAATAKGQVAALRAPLAGEDRAEFSNLSNAAQRMTAAAEAARPWVSTQRAPEMSLNPYALHPEGTALPGRMTAGMEAVAPSALMAQEAARLAAQVNPIDNKEAATGGLLLSPWLLLAPAAGLLLWLYL